MNPFRLCIIPARGGSKRIPRKNIKEFCGKPMIAWSIETAKQSKLFDHVIVSTDDQEIAEVARQWGAEVPFMRPPELADDMTPTRSVVNHAIETVAKEHGFPDHVCVIYATSPFMTTSDLNDAYSLMCKEGYVFAFSAATFPYPIQRAFFINDTGGLQRFFPEHRLTRSQDLMEMYHDAGQFYWGSADAFLSGNDSISERSYPFILPRYRVHDIDTKEDWDRAETIFKVVYPHRK